MPRFSRSMRPAFFALALFGLSGCGNSDASTENGLTMVRLHGEGRVGDVCQAQSERGFAQRCVHREGGIRSKAPVVQFGKCEAIAYPAGCFALLPPVRLSAAEKAQEARTRRQGLPVSLICE